MDIKNMKESVTTNTIGRIPYAVVRKADLKDTHPVRRTLTLVGGGIIAEFFLDPRMGRTRRTQLASRTRGIVGRMLSRHGRRTGAAASGVKAKVTQLRLQPKRFTDAMENAEYQRRAG